MRPTAAIAACALACVALATARADDPVSRARVLRDGKGHWTVDSGGPLGPIEVSMARTPGQWSVTVHGMYPIMDSNGAVQPIATQIMFWLTDFAQGRMVDVDASLQVVHGRWEPGQTFDATFSMPVRTYEDHPRIGLHVAVGDARRTLPSSNLEPPP